MKRLATALALILGASHSFASVIDEDCYLIDMGGYYNLGLEPGCGRTAKEGGWWIDAKRAGDDEEDTDK